MTEQIYHHLSANGHMRKRTVILNNFLGGLAWGFGTVVGATLVVAILLALSKNFTFIPFVKDITNTYEQIKNEGGTQIQQRQNTQP